MMDIAQYIVFAMVGLGMLFAIIRFIKGPSVSDRVVALDTFNIITIGLIALLAMVFQNGLFLDIAIIYAILAFMETITFSRYVEGKHGNH